MTNTKDKTPTSPQVENVQDAMDAFAGQFTPRLTLDLADAPGQLSYPIATYTYLIVYLTSMKNCDEATELFRCADRGSVQGIQSVRARDPKSKCCASMQVTSENWRCTKTWRDLLVLR